MEPLNFLTIGKPYRSVRLRTYLVWATISIIANLCNARTVTTFFIRSYLSMIVWLMLLFNHDRYKAQRCLIFLIYMGLSPWNKAIENLMYTANIVKIGLLFSCLEAWIIKPYMSAGEAILNLVLFIIATYLPGNWKILYLAFKSYFNGITISL
jgi:hypothetical protein